MVGKLTEEQLQTLEATHKKIVVVDWSGHEIGLRRATRDECHAYRVKLESPETKADANEQLCQQLIVALDGSADANAARVIFTGSLLVEFPMLPYSPKMRLALALVMGAVEAEDAADLGKGVTLRPSPPKPTPEGSPSGSATAPAASN